MIDHTLVRQNTIYGDGIVTGDLAINGGDLTTTATTLNLFTANVTTATLLSAATTIAIGAAGVGSKTTINSAQILAGNGTAALPAYSFSAFPDYGVYYAASGVAFSVAGAQRMKLLAGRLSISGDIDLGFNADTILTRDAANTLALRNGVNAQTFNWYATYTDASNYEGGYITAAAGSVTIGARTLGTGTDDVSLNLIATGVGGVLVGSGSATARLQVAGNLSKAAWTTTGIAFDVAAATFTDTSTAGAGTVAVRTANSFSAPTFASTNAITVTDAFTLYVPKPIAGANTTITRANSAYFEGNVGIGTTSPGQKLSVIGNVQGSSFFAPDATGIWTAYNQGGGAFNFRRGADGTLRMSLSDAGGLALGSYAGTDPGTGNIITSGNVIIGATAAGASATFNIVLGGGATSPVLGAATADLVSLAAVDKAAGDRRLYIQSELGTAMSLGNDRLNYGSATGTISIASTDTLFLTTTVLTFVEAVNIAVGTTTGTKIGTATSQKLSLWNATPIVQPTTAHAAATFVANTSGIANDTATWDGYTIGQVVKALRDVGALA